MKGVLYGIGLGPGDPELLTLKALRVLKEADVILVPRGKKSGWGAAGDILSSALGPGLPVRELIFPMERNPGILEAHWDSAASAAGEELDKGKTVAFVTLGDVAFYSTFSYLSRALEKIGEYRIERIPGISSIQHGAARLNRGLALGGSSVGIYPLPDNLEKLDSALAEHETVVVMKIGERLGELRAYLRSRNLEESAGFIRKAGFPDELMALSMESLPDGAEGYLSLAIIGGKSL
jgi:precorrin-2/cobalt-factor-2 C20-methyltransferase